MGNFLGLLATIEPEKRSGRVGQLRFSKEEVEGMYEARKRGVSWEQINDAIRNADGAGYKKSQSLAQTVHNSARIYGIDPPFPNLHRAKTKTAKATNGHAPQHAHA